MGDYIIRTAADIIQNCFSPIGNCYRIGGDEFAVICTNHTGTEVKDALKMYLCKLAQKSS